MNAEQLLEVYEQISEAPNAIARLRRFVLDLAVRGKLVERNATENAQKVGLSPQEPDAPYGLPANWRWMKIGDQLNLLNGMAFKPTDWVSEGIKIVRIQNLNKPDAPFNLCDPAMARERSLIDDGSFLISWSGTPGTSFGAFIWDRGPAVLNQHIFRCDFKTDAYTAPFLKLAINGRLDEMIEKAHGGVGLRHITKGKLQAMLIAVPPLAEQHRIVAKVDELMALCDRLEEARKTREELRDKLTAASLTRLTAPDTTPKDFSAHANFALDALPTHTARPDQIKTLRQTILNLAVRGKLVAQHPLDEPATELLRQMVEERKTTVARRKIRGAKPPLSPSAESEGFDLPSSWRLCSLGQITLITDPNPSHRYPEYSGGTVPILSTREFDGDDGWNAETAKLTTHSFWEFQKEICDFAEGDIIFARKGRLGLPRFLPPFDKFTFSHTLFSIKPMTGLDPTYLLWLLRRDEVVNWLTNEMNQNTGVPTLGKAKTERLPIPLPPLAEQHRIVAKVDALMALCDRLEAALTTADTTRTRLLEALLHKVLEPTSFEAEAAA